MAQQTSINIQPVKGGSEEHNKREKQLDYVRAEFSCLNEYWECDTQSNRLAFCRANAKAKTGRKMQEKATPIREAVVVVKADTTIEDLKRLAQAYKERFGIAAFQIALHKDEGHHKAKEWKPNLHAHIVFDWTDHESGKSIKLNRADMVDMQTITAEVLGMERGVSSDKQHLTALQFKNKKEEEKIALLKAKEESIKVSTARKEALVDTAKSFSESIKSFLGVSTKEKEINALKTQINDQKQEMQVFRDKANKVLNQEFAKYKQEITAKEKIYQDLLAQSQRESKQAKERIEELEKRVHLLYSFWAGAGQALQVIVNLAKDSIRRVFTPAEATAIDTALGNNTEDIRLKLGRELIKKARDYVLPADAGRLENIQKNVDAIAQRREQPLQQSRGIKN